MRCLQKEMVTYNDLCPCGETQTMSHIVESCPLTKLNGGLSWLHSADENAVSWLTSYGSWNAYEKKKTRDVTSSNSNLSKSDNFLTSESDRYTETIFGGIQTLFCVKKYFLTLLCPSAAEVRLLTILAVWHLRCVIKCGWLLATNRCTKSLRNSIMKWLCWNLKTNY